MVPAPSTFARRVGHSPKSCLSRSCTPGSSTSELTTSGFSSRSQREKTHCPTPNTYQGEPGAVFASPSPVLRLKKDDIGVFDPSFPDPKDDGTVSSGNDTVFTDMYAFSERIRTFLETEDTQEAHEKQIMNMLQTLFGGPALR